MYLLRRVRSSFEFLTSNSKEGMTFKTTNKHSIQSTEPKALQEHTNILKIFRKKVHKIKLLSFRTEKSKQVERFFY